jgi:hypothetical protein
MRKQKELPFKASSCSDRNHEPRLIYRKIGIEDKERLVAGKMNPVSFDISHGDSCLGAIRLAPPTRSVILTAARTVLA